MSHVVKSKGGSSNNASPKTGATEPERDALSLKPKQNRTTLPKAGPLALDIWLFMLF